MFTKIEITRKKMLYHAVIFKLVKSAHTIKLVFNRFTSKYELHNLINNKIDWKSNIYESNYDNWARSCLQYVYISLYIICTISKYPIVDNSRPI